MSTKDFLQYLVFTCAVFGFLALGIGLIMFRFRVGATMTRIALGCAVLFIAAASVGYALSTQA